VNTSGRSITSRLDEQGYYLGREGSSRLERNLKRSETGSKLDIRTPFCMGRDREEIIERYKDGLQRTNFEELNTIDEKEISKIGPYSIMLPWSERRETVSAYSHQTYNGVEATLDHVVGDIAKLFAPNAYRPMDLSTAVDSMPRKTMLGLPTMSSDESLIPEYLQRAMNLASAHEIYPFVAGWRGQPKGLHEDPKQRLV
jgi:hypothetical protein